MRGTSQFFMATQRAAEAALLWCRFTCRTFSLWIFFVSFRVLKIILPSPQKALKCDLARALKESGSMEKASVCSFSVTFLSLTSFFPCAPETLLACSPIVEMPAASFSSSEEAVEGFFMLESPREVFVLASLQLY